MTTNQFLTDLVSKSWSSKGDNTLKNPLFNRYSKGDWRYDLIMDNQDYYPPGNVHVKVIPLDVIRDEYTVPHDGHDVPVPASTLKTFTLEVTGDDFAGKEAINAARFIVMGDHAVSSPLRISNTKSVVIVVRLHKLDSGKLVMVNELIWSVQYENEQTGAQTFYDIQKWYCCGYP
ncbi:MAG: hypothetical protein KKD00_08520 [Gammaproteobacteria bacterium]|nr:hypothetical protein [Gammaproteobacteria bacterium]